MSGYIGDFTANQTIVHLVNVADATAQPMASTSESIVVVRDDDAVITDGVAIAANLSGTYGTGVYRVTVQATEASGYETGHDYDVRLVAGSVDGVTVAPKSLFSFSVQNRYMRGTNNANTTAPLDASGVRTAVGLASANLDTQLGDIPTNAELEARTLAAANYATAANLAEVKTVVDGNAVAIADVDTDVTTLMDRIGAFAGSGVNTVLGFLKALMSKDASTPSEVGGTFDAEADSVEAISEAVADIEGGGGGGGATPTEIWTHASRTLTSSTPVVRVVGPVIDAENIEVVVGDDYLHTDGRALSFESDDWPVLTSGSVKLTISDRTTETNVIEESGTVVAADEIRFDLTSAQTGVLVPGRAYRFDVEATLASGSAVTLTRGKWAALEKYST